MTWPRRPWTTCRAAPHKTPAIPDCPKGCPLTAFRLARVVTGLPDGGGLPTRIDVAEGRALKGESFFAGLAQQAPPAK